MRFDDTLETVLAADISTAFGKASAWRQLVDLIGRRRIPDDTRALALLESIRGEVPIAVRITSARSLEMAEPPAALVKLCVVDEIAVAAPILRTARLNSGEWIELLPQLSPPARGILRGRRDLPVGVDGALEGFRAADFVLGTEAPVEEVIEHGRNGWLVDFFDRDGLARAMCEALEAPPGAHDALRNNARETIISRYDLQRICLPKQMALVERLAMG